MDAIKRDEIREMMILQCSEPRHGRDKGDRRTSERKKGLLRGVMILCCTRTLLHIFLPGPKPACMHTHTHTDNIQATHTYKATLLTHRTRSWQAFHAEEALTEDFADKGASSASPFPVLSLLALLCVRV